MKRLLGHRSAQTIVVAAIAVVVALGGTALATSGSGNSRDASAVAAKKKHKRPSRTVRRYVARYVRHHPGPRGRRGPAGDDGTQGPKGATGASGVAVTGYVASKQVAVSPAGQSGDSTNITASCPTGFVPTGGGFDIGDYPAGGGFANDKDLQVGTSDYDDDNLDGKRDGWFIYVTNYGASTDAKATAYAACAQGNDATPAQIAHARSVFADQPALRHHGC